jgi:flagellar L-ring protein FlgH
MKVARVFLLATAAVLGVSLASPATADDLFKNSRWAGLSSDRKGAKAGDVLTVVVYQSAEARNAQRNEAQRKTSIEGRIATDVASENGELSFGGDFSGRGEIRRSESLVTQISVSVVEVLPNGDLLIAGEQQMKVNGEKTRISVRGRVRPADISTGNQVLSTRIADAEINYEGQGFVSRNSNSSPFGWLFSLLGFGG